MYALVSARHRHDGLGCSAVLLGREVPTYRTYVSTSDYLELVLLLAHSTPGEDVESTSGDIHISSGTTSYLLLVTPVQAILLPFTRRNADLLVFSFLWMMLEIAEPRFKICAAQREG